MLISEPTVPFSAQFWLLLVKLAVNKDWPIPDYINIITTHN